MRKTVLFFITLCVLCTFCACNGENTTATTTGPSRPEECQHDLSDATCTQPSRCTLCNRPFGSMLGHLWSDGSCQRCGREDSLYKKEEGITRVVCVGDSITKGGYWSDRFGGYLSENYEVIGLGVNGATGLAAGIDQGKPLAYIDQEEYELSLRYNPDVVVIMLGTNDSKGVNHRKITEDDGEQYKRDITSIIQAYQALKANPTIYLALPPTVYRDKTAESINNENLEATIIPLLLEVAAATGATVIDTHTATANMSECFPDGVHPNADGKAVIAQTVAQAIQVKE